MLVSFTFELEDKTKDKLEKIASEEYRSLAAQIRLALDEYVEQVMDKARRKEDK